MPRMECTPDLSGTGFKCCSRSAPKSEVANRAKNERSLIHYFLLIRLADVRYGRFFGSSRKSPSLRERMERKSFSTSLQFLKDRFLASIISSRRKNRVLPECSA